MHVTKEVCPACGATVSLYGRTMYWLTPEGRDWLLGQLSLLRARVPRRWHRDRLIPGVGMTPRQFSTIRYKGSMRMHRRTFVRLAAALQLGEDDLEWRLCGELKRERLTHYLRVTEKMK